MIENRERRLPQQSISLTDIDPDQPLMLVHEADVAVGILK